MYKFVVLLQSLAVSICCITTIISCEFVVIQQIYTANDYSNTTNCNATANDCSNTTNLHS